MFTKKEWFLRNDFGFFSSTEWKNILNCFDLSVPIKYKIILLKAHFTTNYRTFVIQNSYEGRAFLPPSAKIGLKGSTYFVH